jgi:hypothetical protein
MTPSTICRRRSFSLTPKGLINEGDDLVSVPFGLQGTSSGPGDNPFGSTSSELHLLGNGGQSGERSRASSCNSTGSAYESPESCGETALHRVLMLGGPGVGKTALTQQFLTSEYMAAQNTSFGKAFNISASSNGFADWPGGIACTSMKSQTSRGETGGGLVFAARRTRKGTSDELSTQSAHARCTAGGAQINNNSLVRRGRAFVCLQGAASLAGALSCKKIPRAFAALPPLFCGDFSDQSVSITSMTSHSGECVPMRVKQLDDSSRSKAEARSRHHITRSNQALLAAQQ